MDVVSEKLHTVEDSSCKNILMPSLLVIYTEVLYKHTDFYKLLCASCLDSGITF
jgi:hypothetical protein